MVSIRKNYILNLINTVSGILFPLLTFPYISRILMPEGIGIYNFYTSIVAYVMLLTGLGIPLYAVREVAKYRDDKQLRSKITIEIFVLHFILSLGGYIIIYILGHEIPRITENLILFYTISLGIIFGPFGIQWLYQAIEQFQYITIRSIIVKLFSLVALFLFVKDKDDILVYAIIVLAATVGGNIFNFIYARHFISIRNVKISDLSICRHVKPALHLFVLALIISIYLQLDTVMIGFIKDETAVGLYTAAVKISHVILTIVTSLGVVLLPRFSNLIASGNATEFNRLCCKSISYTIAIALPCTFGIILIAKPLILLLCGSAFESSYTVLQIIAPIIIWAGITNVIGIQILYPLGLESKVIVSTVVGACINFVLNLWLIPLMSQNGAAIATFFAELSVLITQLIVGWKYLPKNFFNKLHVNYLYAAFMMSAAIIFFLQYTTNIWSQVLGSIAIGGSVYLIVLGLRKDIIYQELVALIHKKL